MIPIRDVQSRVIAFTARQLEQTPNDDPAREAKYVNSPETPIFHKGSVLFGIDHARKYLKAGDNFVMVEGQLDAIRCWSVGIDTAVAPQGTAITDEQLQLMNRYQPGCVEWLLDGDKAGRSAALRILPLAFKAGLESRFLLLPEKSDPDDLLRQQGAKALDPLRENSKSAIEFAISEYLPDDQTPSTADKKVALDRIYELLNYIPSQILREDYLSTAAGMLKVKQDEDLHEHLAALKQKRRKTRRRSSKPTPSTNRSSLLTDGTSDLLWLILHFPHCSKKVSEIIDYEWIDEKSPAGSMLRRIVAEIREDIIEDSSDIEHLIDTIEDRTLLADLHSKDLEVDSAENDINRSLNYMYRNYLSNRVTELKRQVANASGDDQRTLMRKVVEARNELAKPHQLQI